MHKDKNVKNQGMMLLNSKERKEEIFFVMTYKAGKQFFFLKNMKDSNKCLPISNWLNRTDQILNVLYPLESSNIVIITAIQVISITYIHIDIDRW